MVVSSNAGPSRVREFGQALAQRLQPVGELALGAALVDVGVPAAEREEGDLHVRVAPHQLRQAAASSGKPLGSGAPLLATICS